MTSLETAIDELNSDDLFVLVADENGEWLRELEDSIADQLAEEERLRREAELLKATEADINGELDEELAYASRKRTFTLSRFAQTLAIACALTLPFPVAIGWSYYSLPLPERAFHELHEVLRPSGFVGLAAGVFGTLLIVSSLIYLLKKRMVSQRIGLGSLRRWMRFHIVTGLLGPAMIVLHSGFLPTSSLGSIAAGAMLVVVLSGLIGRYVLTYMPRAVEGADSGREVVRRRFEVYKKKLVDLGLDQELLGDSEDIREHQNPSLLTAVFRVLWGDRENRQEYRRLKGIVRAHRGLGDAVRLELILVRRLCRERQLLVRYHELRRIIGTWRFLHRWLAVVLLLGAFFHILLAVRYADLWMLNWMGSLSLGMTSSRLGGGLSCF